MMIATFVDQTHIVSSGELRRIMKELNYQKVLVRITNGASRWGGGNCIRK